MERVGLIDKLSDMFRGVRDVTVFAPSNDAFNKLPASLRHQLLGRHDNAPCITSKCTQLMLMNAVTAMYNTKLYKMH